MTYDDLPARLATVRQRIAEAAGRAGRDAAEVGIVAVTKKHPIEAIEAAEAAGLRDLGENRVQELAAKVEALRDRDLRWHLIGHLQRNKARDAVDLADLIHSVDSPRLARKLSREAEEAQRAVSILIQVNTSGEESKGGFEGDGVVEQIAEVCDLPGLRVQGLMTMAPFVDDETILRATFRRTREIAERASDAISGFESRHLSMGMSNDFEIAIEEGSTLVRLGTVLFGERPE